MHFISGFIFYFDCIMYRPMSCSSDGICRTILFQEFHHFVQALKKCPDLIYILPRSHFPFLWKLPEVTIECVAMNYLFKKKTKKNRIEIDRNFDVGQTLLTSTIRWQRHQPTKKRTKNEIAITFIHWKNVATFQGRNCDSFESVPFFLCLFPFHFICFLHFIQIKW